MSGKRALGGHDARRALSASQGYFKLWCVFLIVFGSAFFEIAVRIGRYRRIFVFSKCL